MKKKHIDKKKEPWKTMPTNRKKDERKEGTKRRRKKKAGKRKETNEGRPRRKLTKEKHDPILRKSTARRSWISAPMSPTRENKLSNYLISLRRFMTHDTLSRQDFLRASSLLTACQLFGDGGYSPINIQHYISVCLSVSVPATFSVCLSLSIYIYIRFSICELFVMKNTVGYRLV